MKKICIIIILITSLAIANYYVNLIKHKSIVVKQILLMIDSIEIYLTYEVLSIYEIFIKLKNCEQLHKLGFIDLYIDDCNNNNCIMNTSVLNYINNWKYVDEQDKENIKGFLSMLGKSDLNGQIINCKMYRDLFKRKLEQLELNENTKIKSTLAIIIGIGIIISIVIM